MRKTITAVVPVRKGSQRVPNKSLREFAGSNLLSLKLEVLKQVKTIDNIVVSTDSEEAIAIAKSKGVGYHVRDEYYASSECNNSEFFENLARSIDGDFLMYSPPTAPLISVSTYYDFINTFSNLPKKHDSLLTAAYVKEHLWLEGSPLNYDPKNAPNTQDLPDVLKLTYGACLISKHNMEVCKNVVGNSPMFYVVDDLESIDIDTPLDFEFAEFLYKKHH